MQADAIQSQADSGLSVVPEPDPLVVLKDENTQLRHSVDMLTDQCADHQAQIRVLERDKKEILERLEAHEQNPFTCVLANLENGDVVHAAGEQILRLAELVEQRQEAGKIAIIVTMEPFKMGGAQVAVAELKLTEPKREKNPSIFFYQDGKISRQNQRQESLGI